MLKYLFRYYSFLLFLVWMHVIDVYLINQIYCIPIDVLVIRCMTNKIRWYISVTNIPLEWTTSNKSRCWSNLTCMGWSTVWSGWCVGVKLVDRVLTYVLWDSLFFWIRKSWEECIKKDLEYGLRREDAYDTVKRGEWIKAKIVNSSQLG